MWTVVVALTIAAAPPLSPPIIPLIPQAPYVSCRDGYVVPTLADCPPPRPVREQPRIGHGGSGSRGLLGLGIGGIL